MGIGRLVGNHFDMIVSLRHNASQARVDEWQASFARASELLWDATDGQHRFGTIFVCNNSSGGRNADMWLLDPNGTSSSAVRALGTETAHLTLYGDERFKPYVIIHEFGHYGYGLYDEYTGSAGPAECVGGTTSDACIMEAAWTQGDRFGNNATGGAVVPGRVSEFCVASNHDPDGDTDQERIRGVSCWEYMANTFPGLTVPTSATAGAPGGAGTIDWVVLAPEQRYVLVIDRSGSMQGNKMEQARIGASWWADNAHDNDLLGVVSYATTARPDIGLTPITGDGDRASVRGAIAGINAGGQTSIGGGLREGLNVILAAGQRAATQVMVVITDGLQNAGEHPNTVLPDISSNGIRVYTIGVGPSIDSGLLQNIATSTGGTYYRIDPNLSAQSQEFRIRTVLQEISGIARDNGGVVTTRPENIGREEVIERQILIEEGSESATFAVTWEGEPGAVELELVSPDGEDISLGSMPGNVRPIDTGLPYTGFQVDAPSSGEWTVRMLARGGSAGGGQLFAFSQNPRIDGALYSLSHEYSLSDTIPLFLQTYVDQQVTGLAVSGIAILPDGTIAPLSFGDDGDELTGDAVPKDGTYSAIFDETHDQQGIYTFQVEVTSDGISPFYPESGELRLPDEPLNTARIPEFTRRFTLSVSVGKEEIREPEGEEESEEEPREEPKESTSA